MKLTVLAKHWLKNRAVYSFVLAILIGVFVSLVFVKPNVEAHADNLLLTSVYENSEMDYDIPSPTKAQLNEIEALNFVDDAFGYYYTEGSLRIASKSVKTKILFSDDLESLSMTMYNENRLVRTSEDGLYSNPLYVDYDFYVKNNLSIGDVLYYNNIEFQVGRVYETNSYYGSAIFIPLVGAQKTNIESVTRSYSGAYLKVNDKSQAEGYFRSYKPLGRLKDRSDFDTEEEYQFHYNSWNNASYYNEITSFESKLASANTKTEINYILGFAICAIIVVAVNILLSMRKSERVYFSKKKEKKGVTLYYVITVLIDTALMAVSLLLGTFIIKATMSAFVPNSYFTWIFVAGIVATLCTTAMNAVYDLILCKKLASKNEATSDHE